MPAPVTPPGETARRGTVDIAVLGPMRVRWQSTDHTPSPHMVRRVLATLLVRAGRPTPVAVLIDELWPEAPPRLARKTVQTYISHLRKVLPPVGRAGGGELLTTHASGYVLTLERGELDLWEFERAVDTAHRRWAEGDIAAAAEGLRAALSLWRGTAFAGIEPGRLLASHRTRLEALRTEALEWRIDADLRLGHPQRLLGELSGLTAAHPLNETFAAQLMLAAERAGHRAAAIAAYAGLRRALAEQLGVEPSRRLRRLYHDIRDEVGCSDRVRGFTGPDRS